MSTREAAAVLNINQLFNHKLHYQFQISTRPAMQQMHMNILYMYIHTAIYHSLPTQVHTHKKE